MPGLAVYGEDLVLNAIMNNRYISFHIGEPDGAGNMEVSGAGYARTPQGEWVINGTDPAEIHNDTILTSPIATNGSWGTITHFGVWDALTGGNFLGAWALQTSHQIDEGGYVRAAVGSLKVRVD